jgi:hypothetical protein
MPDLMSLATNVALKKVCDMCDFEGGENWEIG